MAEILRGKDKGQNVEIHQFCNDWFMGKNGKIYSPTSLQFKLSEVFMILEAKEKGQCGLLFGLYEFENGRFKKRKRR